ncbi:MAG: ABC transporter permease [Qingshengfaniella sp.]
MLMFLLRRVLQSVFVIMVVSLVSFAMFQFAGDPVENLVSQETTLEEREALREELGLNDPVPVQFLHFAKRALEGNFGISYRVRQPVVPLILNRLPATLELVAISAVVAMIMGAILGIWTALKPKSWATNAIMGLSLVGISLPTFLIGIGLIYVFSVKLSWLPSFGRGEVVDFGWWTTGLLTASGWKSLVLPALTMAMFQTALIMRLIRSEMMEVLRQEYIRFARARGLPSRRINYRHALKNTLVPVITVVGLMLGSIIAFSVVTETVFQWPGVGSLFIASIAVVDVPVMSVYLIFIALLFVTINLIVDILYFLIDPRLRVRASR